MNSDFIKKARLHFKCKSEGIDNINKCYFPSCDEKSINSHILQKNGILNKISADSHLWEYTTNFFKEEKFVFKKTGLKKIFSFNCFCKKHDNDLFKEIENVDLDFTNYKTNLLFTLRTLYNEIFKKQVNVKMHECFLREDFQNYDNEKVYERIDDEILGIGDMQLLENKIWNDLNNSTESFTFNYRYIDNIGLCMSSFFTYDTSEEIEEIELTTGKKLDRYSEIFINIFPYKESAVLMIAYEKIDENKVKDYVSDFFNESNIGLCYQKITNLVLFNCENWVVNDDFYRTYIQGVEYKFREATNFAIDENNKNERTNFDISFYENDFKEKFKSLIIK